MGQRKVCQDSSAVWFLSGFHGTSKCQVLLLYVGFWIVLKIMWSNKMISSRTTWNDSKGEAIKLWRKGWQPHLPNLMVLRVRLVLLAMEPLGCGSLLGVHHWGQALMVYSLILLSVFYLCSILNMWSLSLLLWQPAIIYSKVRDLTNPRKLGVSLVPGVFSLLLSRPKSNQTAIGHHQDVNATITPLGIYSLLWTMGIITG